ncbi:MAG: hypothetical protein ACP5VR_12860, partial [Acidimicrobiales bacterium]
MEERRSSRGDRAGGCGRIGAPAGVDSECTAPPSGAVGKVRNATACHLAVLGDHGVKVTLPKPADCAGGTYREPVGLGPNATKSPVTVKLGLFAGPALGVFYVVVVKPVPAHPGILEARANPWEMSYKGGWTTITGKIVNAKTCHLVALDWAHPELAAQPCTSGNFTQKLWLSPNAKPVV